MISSQIVTIDRFLGLNEDIAGDTQLKVGESPFMNNFRITEVGKLVKRYGYKSVFDNIGSYTITGMWYGKVNGAEQLVFSASNNNIYKVINIFNANGDLLENTFPLSTPTTIIGTTTTSDPVSFFYFNSKLYFVNGTDYKVYDGTGSFANVTPYVPLIKTACTPNGVGTDFESLNMLTGKKWQMYNGDGTSKDYFLVENSITSVYQVKVNGVVKTATTDYTVDLAAGKVTFVTAPSSGALNVEIYWQKGSGSPLEITTQKFATVFNKELVSRVFLYGSTDSSTQRNRVYYSGKRVDTQTDVAEYFPALNVLDVGDTQYPITGIIPQYDRLIVSKTKDTHYITMSTSADFSSATGDSVITTYVSKLNDSIGNVAPGQQQIILNNPFVLSNGVYEFTNTNVKDERNARYMSKRVNQTLDTNSLKEAITTECSTEKEYWIAIGKTVWVYNYAWDVWYKFTLAHKPTFFLEVNGYMFFGTIYGKIMYFKPGELTDEGQIISAHWESGFMDFGSSWQRKYLNRMWLSTKPGIPTDIKLGWLTDGNSAQQTTDIYMQSLFNFGSVNFADFTFDISDNPKPKLLKIKAKKFAYFKLLIDSSSLSATILAINLSIQKGGASK